MSYHVVDGLGGQWLAEDIDGELSGIGRVEEILRESSEYQRIRSQLESVRERGNSVSPYELRRILDAAGQEGEPT